MKILCVLQNAWGDRNLPIIFSPNPYNKSAKVIRKMVGNVRFYFSNTTNEVTRNASGRARPNDEHFLSLINKFKDFDLILVCGSQAKKMFEKHSSEIKGSKMMYVPHPASRMLSNVEISKIQRKIEILKNIHEAKRI